MGYKTAAQVLQAEINHIRRRIDRIKAEMERLAGTEHGLSDLRAEGFLNQITALEFELENYIREYEKRKDDKGARHTNQMIMKSEMMRLNPGSKSWKNR